MQPDPKMIDDLVRRIVEAVHPLRIILFGSAARGEMGPNSDLDVLVVMPDGTHRCNASEEIYRQMWGFGFAKDIIVVTESDVQDHRSNPYMIIKNALDEGKELYLDFGKLEYRSGGRISLLTGAPTCASQETCATSAPCFNLPKSNYHSRERSLTMPLNQPIPGSPLDWLGRAKGSLALAKQPKPEDAFWEDLCFQAQQAVEKAIKAVYQHKSLLFRYTHDLEELGKGLQDKGIPIPLTLQEAALLAKYAFETRYPGRFESVSEEKYREAVRLAEAVVAWAESIISAPNTP